MKKDGMGLYLELQNQSRQKIIQLGLNSNKKKLNSFPLTIGIITAIEGAAIQDILQTFRLDNFVGNIIIKNSIVQGSQCPKSLIESIEWFENSYTSKQLDILMITRGGGGYEDLVGFSNWDLVVKISTLGYITLSAVGHQIDNQLSDDVSDYKFATPSIGAKFIVEKQREYMEKINLWKKILESRHNAYVQGKKIFDSITLNYPNIMEKYQRQIIVLKIKKYSNILNGVVSKYLRAKNTFYSKLSNIKPSIFKKNEITSINDFINDDGIESKSKKIDIYFVDGKIKLGYKIVEYEHY